MRLHRRQLQAQVGTRGRLDIRRRGRQSGGHEHCRQQGGHERCRQRGQQAVLRQAEIVELGETAGEIPVVPFDIPEPNAEDFIRHAFRRITVRLVTQDLRNQVLVVLEPDSGEDVKD